MASVEVKLEGFTRAGRRLELLAEEIERESRDAVRELGEDAELIFAAHALRRSGRMARGIASHAVGDAAVITAEARDPRTGFCVDEETEVLTDRGWLNLDQVQAGDRALGLDPETREIRWAGISAVNIFDSPGELHRWQGTTFDALTTPNHRWLATSSGERGGDVSTRSKASEHFTTTEEVGAKRLICSGGSPLVSTDGPFAGELSDELVELIGWYVTEGSDLPNGRQGVVISQSAKHNPGYVERLRGLAAHFREQGATANEYAPRDLGYGPIVSFYFGAGIGSVLRTLCPDKSLPMELLCSLTADQRLMLFDTLLDGDGHRSRAKKAHQCSQSWSQRSRGRVDAFTALAAMLGYRTGIHSYAGQRGGFTVSVYKVGLTYPREIDKGREPYSGRVWCPTTTTGTWMARRNGVSYWTGNSYVAVTRFGHRVARIYPKKAKALRFEINGRVVFAKSVRGFKPATDWRDDALPAVNAQAEAVMTRLGRRIEVMA